MCVYVHVHVLHACTCLFAELPTLGSENEVSDW